MAVLSPSWSYSSSPLQLISLITLTLSLRICLANYLFRASPGGDGIKPAGLWGGEIDFYAEGKAEYLYQVGYGQLTIGNEQITDMDINSVSYDPVSKQVILEIEDSASDSGTIIAHAAPCSASGELKALAGHVRLTDPDNPYLIETECGWKCGWNAFAYYDSKIYFVLSAVFGPHLGDLTREIQVRVLKGCKDIMADQANQGHNVVDFNILECSDHITTIHHQRYAWPNPTLSVWAGSAMLARYVSPDLPLQVCEFQFDI